MRQAKRVDGMVDILFIIIIVSAVQWCSGAKFRGSGSGVRSSPFPHHLRTISSQSEGADGTDG